MATARRAFDSAPSAGPLSASQTRAQSDSDRDRISGDATVIEKHEAQRIEAGRHCVPRGPSERDVSAIVGALIDAYAAQKGSSTVGEVIGGLLLEPSVFRSGILMRCVRSARYPSGSNG